MEMNFDENWIKMPKSMICIEFWDGDPSLIKSWVFHLIQCSLREIDGSQWILNQRCLRPWQASSFEMKTLAQIERGREGLSAEKSQAFGLI